MWKFYFIPALLLLTAGSTFAHKPEMVWPKNKVNLSDSFLPPVVQVVTYLMHKIDSQGSLPILIASETLTNDTSMSNVTSDITNEGTTESISNITVTTDITTSSTEAINISTNVSANEATTLIPVHVTETDPSTGSVSGLDSATATVDTTSYLPPTLETTSYVPPTLETTSYVPSTLETISYVPVTFEFTQPSSITTASNVEIITNTGDSIETLPKPEIQELFIGEDFEDIWRYEARHHWGQDLRPAVAYILLGRLRETLSNEAKRRGFSKMQGYSESVLKVLVNTSTGTSAQQLITLLTLMLDNKDVKNRGSISQSKLILDHLENKPAGALCRSLEKVSPMQFIP